MGRKRLCFLIKSHGPDTKFAFPCQWPYLAKISLSQGHETSSGHKQVVCEVKTFNMSQKTIITGHEFCTDDGQWLTMTTPKKLWW